MTNGLNSCRDCKYLVRYKVVGDVFWHYRCMNYPNSKEFDTWKSLTVSRNGSNCGYKKKEEDKPYKSPWYTKGGLSAYPFQSRYYDKIKSKKE